MPAIKLVYFFIIAIIALILFLFFTGTLSNVGYKVVDVLTGFVEGGTGSLSCSVGVQGNNCAKLSDKDACTSETDGEDCLWCSGEINGAVVGSCQARVCGCGNLRSTNVISISADMGEFFRPGETLLVEGRVQRAGRVVDGSGNVIQTGGILGGLTVEYSFLDSGKSPTDEVGLGGKVTTEDDGSFRIEHVISENAPKTRYYVYVRFADAKDWEDFVVG